MPRSLTSALVFLVCLLGMTTPTTAAAQQAKPELKVASGFWPMSAIQYVPTTSMWLVPISMERRWIGYADGKQVTAIEFYEIAGQGEEVDRLKKRRNKGWVMTTLGYAGLGVAMASSERLITGSSAERMIPLAAVVIGVPTALVGLHTLAFRGTRKADAKKVAEQHNAGR